MSSRARALGRLKGGLSLLSVMLLMLSLAVALTACGGPALTPEEEALRKDIPGSPSDQPVRTEINLPLPALPRTLDPGADLSMPERAVADQLYEGLTSYSSHRRVKLMQAQRLETTDGGKTWEIELRPDLKWSDGSPVTAEDYRRSWIERLSPEHKEGPVYLAYVIRGARAYHEARAEEKELGLRVEDGLLKIELERPFPRFDQWLSHPFFYPVKTSAEGKALYNGAYVPEKPIPTAESAPADAAEAAEQHFTLTVNPQYWDAVNLRIKALHFQVFATGIEAYEGWRSGVTDYIGDPFFPVPRKRREEASRRAECLLFDVSSVGYFALNTEHFFFASPERREALYALLDPRFLSGAILFDGSPAYPDRPSPTAELKQKESDKLNQSLTDEQKQQLTETGLYGLAGPELTDYRLMVASSKEWLGALRIRLDLRRVPEPGDTRRPDWEYRRDFIPSDQVNDWALLLQLRDGLELSAESPDPAEGFDPAELPVKLGYLPLEQRRAMVLITQGLAGVQVTPAGSAYVKDWNFR